jgi:hypothetical protein
MTCINQVWGNGDMESCDLPTGHPDNHYCPKCLRFKLPHVDGEIQKLEAKLVLQKRLRAKLMAEMERI